jgi:thiol-disulfide isomerase/thioredoxin
MKRQSQVRSRWGIRIALAATVAVSGCASAGLPPSATPGPAAAADPGWPSVPVADLEGHPVTLGKLVAGRPALVNLWAPWCERCKTELPDLDRLARQLEGCAVVVGVAVGEDAPRTAAFVHERGLAYPQLVDEGFHLADALRQSRVPTTLVIDGEGAIVHVGLAVDQAAVGALMSTLGRADASGHCKGSRRAGASEQHPRTLVGLTAGFRGHDASAAQIGEKDADFPASRVEYRVCRTVTP